MVYLPNKDSLIFASRFVKTSMVDRVPDCRPARTMPAEISNIRGNDNCGFIVKNLVPLLSLVFLLGFFNELVDKIDHNGDYHE